MNGPPIYNARILKNYIEYLKINYPALDIAAILDHARITTYQLNDEGHWFTQEQLNRFHEIITPLTNNPDISREVGRYSTSSKASGALKSYLHGFVTPAAAYALVEKLAANLTRAVTFKTRSLGSQSMEVTVTQNPGICETKAQCDNRLGTMEALAKFYTDKYAKIDHPSCIHRGDERCVYLISWEEPPSLIWKRIRNYATVLGVLTCAFLPFFLSPLGTLAGVLFGLALILAISYHAEHVDRRKLSQTIESQGDAAGRLLDQINVSYNNALLVQEIGQATSMILDINKLLVFIIEALEKRLDFDRGMIMLANHERTHLIYTIGYGYNPEQRNYLENIEFNLNNPQSRGAFVVSFRKQLPLLVNNVSEIVKEISPKSVEFAKRMGTHSFICVPIVFKGESLGILVVDNIRSKRLFGQSDMSLMMGIAPQIAISIHNAMSYRKITESEERFRSLSECAPDIIYTIDSYGAFTYVNPAWQRILGHSTDEVIGKELIHFVRGGQIPVYDRLFNKVLSEQQTIQDFIGTLVHKDGSDRYFSISGSPNMDSEGRMIGIVGTLKDVTDLMLSEVKLKKSFEKIQTALDSTIQAISKIVESRDPYTAGHQERVASLAVAIAEKMNLSEDLIASIRMAATLHDVGKINVPAEILSRPRLLNNVEMGMIRMHPEIGYGILASIEFPYPVAQIVLQHHEKMDGSGYPTGLAGEDILLEARILAVADVVEAMATHRPYRPSLGLEKTLEEISFHKGTLYDEAVVDTCLKLFDEKTFTF
ncbi:MAG: PAS domain S-box protein [Deltaproteobacteria bacterium]|nr:PAS domain S-box protein [Deltaproteobacteria bacterium]